MFRLVTHQLRLARRVVDSVGVIASTVASVLDPRLSSYLEEGQTLDGIGSVQIGLVRWIEDAQLALRALVDRFLEYRHQVLPHEARDGAFCRCRSTAASVWKAAHGHRIVGPLPPSNPSELLGEPPPASGRRSVEKTVGFE
jgi:hypothetical protein